MTIKKAGLITLLIVAPVGMSGCGLILGTAAVGTAAAVGTVGLAGYTVVGTAAIAGYTVYKGGEAVVSTVGSVGSSTRRTVQKQTHAVVVSRGTLKTKSGHAIAELYPAAEMVFGGAGFTAIRGTHDSLAGLIRARTALGEDVSITFELLREDLTAVEIRIGAGNLKQSEFLYDQILATIAASNGSGE